MSSRYENFFLFYNFNLVLFRQFCIGPRRPSCFNGFAHTRLGLLDRRENARKNGIKNVEFRLGEIENLPIADDSVDVVISNCVINLSADKPKAFKEVCRVLRSGGRIAISDIALLKELPKKIQESIEAYVGCVGGAIIVDEYKKIVEASGFRNVKITIKGSSACIDPNTKDPIGRAILDSLGKDESLAGFVVSIYVEGYK